MSQFESSCFLFHGPSAQAKASIEASEWGRVVGTYGDPRKGLDIETGRQVLAALSSPPVGDRRGALVIGPVDVLTQEGVLDLLLKTLEEGHRHAPKAFLWAWDVGSVRPTIRSRCLLVWCPGYLPLDPNLISVAQSVVSAVLRKSTAGVLESMATLREDWKDHASDFKVVVADVLSKNKTSEGIQLWVQLRPLLVSGSALSYQEMVAGFLP